MNVSQSPEQTREPCDVLETRAKAALRQAIWEADQYMGLSEIETFVGDVLDEIESDRP